MVDVISYGEVMVRITPERFRTFLNSNTWNVEIGGAEANVLIPLSILGLKTEFISFFPNSFLGYKALSELKKYGIGVSRVKLVSEGRMGLYFVELHHRKKGIKVLYDRKNSSFSLTQLTDLDLDYIRKARLIHLTGITPSLSEICKDNVIKICKSKKGNQKISFDVNYRQKLWEVDECRRFINMILPFVDILFIKREDYRLLFGDELEDEKILYTLQKKFGEDKIYVLTKGEEGCSVLFKDKYFVRQALSTDIVDRIGAGDAFVAGFLYGYLKDKNLEECAKYGNILASLKMSVFGDFLALDEDTLQNSINSSNNEWSVER
ncbi:MAG: sugar kinase [Dictyoglomaceae bacterium]